MSTYTNNSGIEKPGSGEQAGAWGDTVNTNFKINKVNFYNLKNKKVNSEKVDDLVDNYEDRRFEYLNSISFKNFLKEIIYTYFEFG